MFQVLQESLSIPGTDIYLVYRSSQTSGYMSTIVIQLTPDQLPEGLVIVRLRIVVEGLVFERVFEADPNLRYRFTWDRRNAYNQKVYGIVTANGEMRLCFVLCPWGETPKFLGRPVPNPSLHFLPPPSYLSSPFRSLPCPPFPCLHL